MKFLNNISVHQILLNFKMIYNLLQSTLTLFWRWLKSTFTSYEDDISYGIKLEQEYQNTIASKKINA
jgi:hypothetical protein